MDRDCPFCGSAFKENRILKQGKYTYVLLSNPRLMPGHILVVTKRHITGELNQLSKEEKDEIFELLSEFQTKILKKLSSGCDIRQNFKPFVKDGRTHVNHMHWHLNPRELEDELYQKADIHRKPLYRDLEPGEVEKIFNLLKD